MSRLLPLLAATLIALAIPILPQAATPRTPPHSESPPASTPLTPGNIILLKHPAPLRLLPQQQGIATTVPATARVKILDQAPADFGTTPLFRVRLMTPGCTPTPANPPPPGISNGCLEGWMTSHDLE